MLIFAEGPPQDLEEGYMVVDIKRKVADDFFGVFLSYETDTV